MRVNKFAERSLREISQFKLKTIYGDNGMLYQVCVLMNEGDRLSLGRNSNQKE